jgi:hypothetical protein
MLLPFVRLCIDGPTPLHLFEASTEGTGKGKLGNAVAFPSLGRPLTPMTQLEDVAEWRKTLTTSFAEAASHIFIDNMFNPKDWNGSERPIDSAPLAMGLTERWWKGRLLGLNRSIEARISCVWMATGNNLEWSKELARRVVTIRLTAPSENPSGRSGWACAPMTLEEWAHKHHRHLLEACLTLCRNWFAKDKPMGVKVMGSYENYSKVMGGILAAAGVGGFLGNLGRAVVKDRDSRRWPLLVAEWHRRFLDAPVGTKELFELIHGSPIKEADPETKKEKTIYVGSHEELKAEFADVTGDGKIDSKRGKFAQALIRHVDRVWAGQRIRAAGWDSHGKRQLYKLVDPALVESDETTTDETQVHTPCGVVEDDTPF